MKYFVLGNGDYARLMRRYLKNTKDIKISAFTVDRSVITNESIDNTPVIPTEEMLDYCNPSDCRLFLGIGYRNMNQIKQKEFNRYKELGYIFENYIHPTAIVDEHTIMGEGNNIFEGVIIQEGVRIGDANLIYAGSLVAHETIIGDFNSFSVKVCVAGCSQVQDNCFLGANSTIRDHIILSDYTLVGAGAYVSKNTCPYDVIVPQKSSVLEKKSLEFI